MKLFNSLTGRVEDFEPKGKQVSIYVCGITPYDTTHLGHAFTYTVFDVLIRYFLVRGLKVNYVQNVTDIDDDILRKAKEVGEDWEAVVNRWTTRYIRGMQNLNVLPPDHFPRATAVIPQIINRVQKLVDAGLAYAGDGNVYYSIDAWPEFGKLSQLSRDEMLPIANERGNHPDDPGKRDPLDFVLWQAKATDEPSWPSPWGPGRPGWHIECSTMVNEFIGDQVDIHGGGVDLCFPHHECEIAQVEPITGREPFTRFWVHTAMVRYEGEKMSKSLGNLIMVEDLLDRYPPDALRLYLGKRCYREAWSFEEDKLRDAVDQAEKIKGAVMANGGNGVALNTESAWSSFTASMDDDLDTSGAIQVMENLVDEIREASLANRDVEEAQTTLRTLSSVFGLRLDQENADRKVIKGWNDHLEDFVKATPR